MTKTILFAAILAVTAIISAPVLAEAAGSYLNFKKATITENNYLDRVGLFAKMNAKIPSQILAGVGILTDGTLVVSTIHPGVFDSLKQVQDNPASPKDSAIPHNHYVDLTPAEDSTDCTDKNFQVARLSHESPGITVVKGKWWNAFLVKQSDVVQNFLTGQDEQFTVGDLGDGTAVSFTLSAPKGLDANGIPVDGAVCVEVFEGFDARLRTFG